MLYGSGNVFWKYVALLRRSYSLREQELSNFVTSSYRNFPVAISQYIAGAINPYARMLSARGGSQSSKIEA